MNEEILKEKIKSLKDVIQTYEKKFTEIKKVSPDMYKELIGERVTIHTSEHPVICYPEEIVGNFIKCKTNRDNTLYINFNEIKSISIMKNE